MTGPPSRSSPPPLTTRCQGNSFRLKEVTRHRMIGEEVHLSKPRCHPCKEKMKTESTLAEQSTSKTSTGHLTWRKIMIFIPLESLKCLVSNVVDFMSITIF